MNIPFFDYPAVFSKYKDSFLEIFDKVSSKGSFIMQDELLNFEKKLQLIQSATLLLELEMLLMH